MVVDINTARRRHLEKKAVLAALELLAFTEAAAVVLPVPETNPPLFLAIGDAEQLRASFADADD